MKKKNNSKYKLKREVSIILLKSIIDNNNSIFSDSEFNNLLENKKYRRYFDKYMLNLYSFYKNKGYFKTSRFNLNAFLHNIYYKYLSCSHKNALNHLNLNKISIKTNIMDARKAILDDNYTYNLIFLDAFTPAKCPSLWSLDFFKLLYSHLDEDGVILTYSNSANVRNAFVQAGFKIYKIYNKLSAKYLGTAAVKNKSLILNNYYLYELSEYDLGLLKTKAGIVYRDENLTLDNEAILAAHEKEVKNSELMSSSKYIKTYKGEK